MDNELNKNLPKEQEKAPENTEAGSPKALEDLHAKVSRMLWETERIMLNPRVKKEVAIDNQPSAML